MKKAFEWLDSNNLPYSFHDYKKSGADDDILKKAIKAYGWETVINRRGMTWRKLSDEVKSSMDEAAAIAIAHENPSIIKRPIIEADNTLLLGFDIENYKALL